MLETLDIERSIWDLEYRRKVKRILNRHARPDASAANDDSQARRASEAQATS